MMTTGTLLPAIADRSSGRACGVGTLARRRADSERCGSAYDSRCSRKPMHQQVATAFPVVSVMVTRNHRFVSTGENCASVPAPGSLNGPPPHVDQLIWSIDSSKTIVNVARFEPPLR